MRKVYRAYFAVALMLGFHRHVYRVSNRWGGASDKVSRAQYSAAAEATEMLISDGYHRCPTCTWATMNKNEHVHDVGSFCHEERLGYLRRRRRSDFELFPEEVAELALMQRIRRRSSVPPNLQYYVPPHARFNPFG